MADEADKAIIHPELQRIIDGAKGMTVTTRNSPEYAELKKVHNARLHFEPAVIVSCGTRDDVAYWLRELDAWLTKEPDVKLPISVRSGGHHHEGMCANNNGVVLMLNPNVPIEVNAAETEVTVGTGTQLGSIIKALEGHSRMMPTGGCSTVNVGGLTHGGGWGMSYRNTGLTVDALKQVEMVMPNGEFATFNNKVFLDNPKSYPDLTAHELFWAVCGGGGGNFGVATKFTFHLYNPGPKYTSFTLLFDKLQRAKAAQAWIDICREDKNTPLNTFARMLVNDGDGSTAEDPGFSVGGVYYGLEDPCIDALKTLLALEPFSYSIEEKDFGPKGSFLGAAFLTGPSAPRDTLTGQPLPRQAYALQLGSRPDTDCDVSEPHKVTSAMPKKGADADLIRIAEKYVDDPSTRKGIDPDNVNLYLSFHGMGGAGKHNSAADASYPWRKKDYMLQVQAWWANGMCKETENTAIEWVEGFRIQLKDHSDGAFINFPDRKQKVSDYYKGSLTGLKGVKSKTDPDNRLDFDMGLSRA